MREVFMERSIAARATDSSLGVMGRAGFMLAACAACTFPAQSYAADAWNGTDKRVHASFSCAFGLGAAAWQPQSAGKAWLIAMVPGVIKEAADATTATGTGWSWKDMAANALGAGVCVAGGRLLLSSSEGRAQATYTWEY